jgi:CRISPR-associated protein Cas2
MEGAAMKQKSAARPLDPEMAHVRSGQHKLIICYDVSDNKRRTKLSWLLESYGARVQKSVFEAVLTEAMSKRLVQNMERLLTPEDDLRIYFLPPSGWEKIQTWGPNKDKRPGEELYWIV